MRITRRNFLWSASLGPLSLIQIKKQGLPPMLTRKAIHSSKDPWIELNLANMGWNLARIRSLVKVPVMAVIKANAYGHGLLEVGHYLEKCGIDFFMVGKLKEALSLRKTGVRTPVLNFGSFSREEAEELILNNICQSVFDEEVFWLDRAAFRLGKKAEVNIHLDTGMGRMGIPFKKAPGFIEKVAAMKNLFIKGVSTTLTEDDDFDRQQLERFTELCSTAEKKGINLGLKHAASSDGIMDLPQSWLDMVRPGIMLYGYYPSEKTQMEDGLSLRPVLELKARVVSIKEFFPGDSLSYHRVYKVRKRQKIAVLPIGYSDGYPFQAVNKAYVLIRGRKHQLIAAVTANHALALLDKNSEVAVGDEAVLLGVQGKERISAFDIAGWAGASTYKVLIGLNPLLPRKIV
ncbi:MAG: alanine racemase [Candidatus Aminicenantales bacterium]